MLTDTHVHVSLAPDPRRWLEAAAAAGIALIAPTVNLKDARQALQLMAQGGPSCMVGAHPWYQDEVLDDGAFRELLTVPGIIGIGECGLDQWRGPDLAVQEENLDLALTLAAALNLPLSLHIRGCHGRLLSQLRRRQGRVRGVIHGFTFSPELCRQYLDLGMVIGLGHLTVHKARRLAGAITYAGADHVVLETDVAQETRDYPVDTLKAIFKATAEILDLPAVRLEAAIGATVAGLFGTPA